MDSISYSSNNTSMHKEASIPNARLGSEVPLVEGTSSLGSSQIDGCNGDFCDFDLSFIESAATNNSQKVDKNLSDFRRKLMASDIGGQELSGSYLGSLMKSADSVNGSGSVAGDLSFTSSTKQRNLHVGAKSTDSFRKIPYRAILQARQEMPLVKLQLRRHRNNEPGDYVSADSYNDLAVSTRLPGQVYKDVPCCLNCYKVE